MLDFFPSTQLEVSTDGPWEIYAVYDGGGERGGGEGKDNVKGHGGQSPGQDFWGNRAVGSATYLS